MASLLTSPALSEPRTGLTDDHLAALANTYDHIASPIRIHDAQDRCVYKNRQAATNEPHHSFDILDECDRVVGRLTMPIA